MNWIKENPVPSGILGAGILAALAVAFLASQASVRETEALNELSRQASRLEGFQRRQPPATEAGLAAAEKSLAGYRSALASLASALAAKEEPLEPVSPEKFQDELRKYANLIAQTAADKKATLPDPFLFGFEEFQDQLPPVEQTPELHREFKVVRRLVESLLALGISSIDLLERGTPSSTAEPGEEPEGGGKAPQAPAPTQPDLPPPIVVPFRLAFTAKQDSAIGALNLVAADPQFLVIRSLALENTSPEPPSRKTEVEAAAPATPFEILLPGEEPKQKLQVVLGSELVKTTLDLEIIDFPAAPAPAAD